MSGYCLRIPAVYMRIITHEEEIVKCLSARKLRGRKRPKFADHTQRLSAIRYTLTDEMLTLAAEYSTTIVYIGVMT